MTDAPQLAPVPCATSTEEFLDYVARREPAVYRIAGGSEASWRREIEAALGQTTLPVRAEATPAADFAPKAYHQFWGYLRASIAAQTSQRMTLADARQQSTEQHQRWMISGIDASLPESARSAVQALDALMPRGCVAQKTGVWISSAGCATPLHWDAFGPHNFHMLLCGRKRLDLFAHAEATNLYCYGGLRYVTRFAAAVDCGRPDLRRYPLYAGAKGLTVTLEAGDVLFIPAFWWHHALHLGDFNVSATRWYDEPHDTHPREPPLPLRVHLNWVIYLVCEPIVDMLLWLLRTLYSGCLARVARSPWPTRRLNKRD